MTQILCALFVKDMHFSNAHMYKVSKQLFVKDSCMHVLRDARNLELFSQVPSSLFTANLRELALILSKNSDSKIESNLSKRNKKQDPSLQVGTMTTDASSLVSFLKCFVVVGQ